MKKLALALALAFAALGGGIALTVPNPAVACGNSNGCATSNGGG